MQVIPISPLLEKVFTHGQLQDVSPGCGHSFLHGIGELCWCQLLVNVVSGSLDVFVSPVQSTSVQTEISYTHN